jgi:hypothetical protein
MKQECQPLDHNIRSCTLKLCALHTRFLNQAQFTKFSNFASVPQTEKYQTGKETSGSASDCQKCNGEVELHTKISVTEVLVAGYRNHYVQSGRDYFNMDKFY